MSGKAAQRWSRRSRLYAHQKGLCHWCKKPMQLLKMPAKSKKTIRDLCTIDHLDDRWSEERGHHPGEYRVVAACWQCNWERNKERQASLPRQTLWAASRAYPREMRE